MPTQCANPNCKKWDGPKVKSFGKGRYPPVDYIDPTKIKAGAKVCDACYFDVNSNAWPAEFYVANGVRPFKQGAAGTAVDVPSSVRLSIFLRFCCCCCCCCCVCCYSC